MKSSLAKVSLALLFAVFILGCQDVGSGPVGPGGLEIQAKRGNDKSKGDGSSTLAKLTISGGMITDPNQEVAFFDGKNQFSVQAHDNTIGDRIELAMNLSVSAGDCEPDDRAALLEKLNAEDPITPQQRRQLFITVGKDGIDHKIGVTWDDSDGSFRMELRPNSVSTDGEFKKNSLLVFTFTGGTVVLRDVTEKRPKDRIRVTCSLANAPDIVMVLTPA